MAPISDRARPPIQSPVCRAVGRNMAKILDLLSPRRQAYPAGTIRDQLAARFGRQNVFMDIDSIPFGQISELTSNAELGIATTWSR